MEPESSFYKKPLNSIKNLLKRVIGIGKTNWLQKAVDTNPSFVFIIIGINDFDFCWKRNFSFPGAGHM